MKKSETLSICIVDDDEMFLNSLKHYLMEKLKYTTSIKLFHTGEEFLKHIHDQKNDIVILDYMLNGIYPHAMDGRSVLQKIKQLYPNMTVVMISGQDKIDVALDIVKEGAYDYVVKNDNVFLKLQNILKNAVNGILISRRLNRYKRWFTTTVLLFSAAIIIDILIKIYFYDQL